MVIAARGLRKFMREGLNGGRKWYSLTAFLDVGEMRANRGWSTGDFGPGYSTLIFVSLYFLFDGCTEVIMKHTV